MNLQRQLFTLTAFVAVFALSGCNTVQGIGKDLKQGGEAIEKAAKN